MVAWWKAKGGKISRKTSISYGRMVEGKGRESLNKDFDFIWSHGGRQRGGTFKERLTIQS